MGISYNNPYPNDGNFGGGGIIPPTLPEEPEDPPVSNEELELIQERLDSLEEKINNSSGVNGGVFITDITSSEGNVGNKSFSSDGMVLDSCRVDTNRVTLSILAVTGNTNYKPVVYVKSNQVELKSKEDAPLFEGTIDVFLDDAEEITVKHEDGAQHTVNIIHEAKPEILSAIFTGGYPGSQTELKEGDSFDLNIKTNDPITKIEIDNESACKHLIKEVDPTTDKTIKISIADRGNIKQDRYAKVRVQKPSGSWSDWYLTNTNGSTDGKHVVACNNAYPVINIDSISYPAGQKALKESEEASINHTVNDYDSVSYVSILNELSIENENTYENPKTVSRINGDYNASNNNFKIKAVRNANAAVTTKELVIKIANIPAEIIVEEQNSRLRSSETGSLYNITLKSNQELIVSPKLNLSNGSWHDSYFSGGPSIWNRKISISDSDTKGMSYYSGLVAKNLSGLETNVITGDKAYIIGGFTNREIKFDPFSQIAPIGTSVRDTSKLVCVDISGDVFTYTPYKENKSKSFTIVNQDGELDPRGDHIWITDKNWTDQNSTGLAYVELQETI
jgi:hypothetical protein